MSHDEKETYATVAAVAGLAAEVDALRRRIEPVHKVPGQLAKLAGQVATLAEELANLRKNPDTPAVPSWLQAPKDAEHVRGVLDELVAWMDAIFLRYADAAAALPDCWAWHPDVIEELLWLMEAWLVAYQGEAASAALVGDWHDRYRPGVVRRIKASAGNCSLENHTPPRAATTVPLADSVDPIVAWWAGDREAPAPEPTDEQFAAATPRRRLGGVRR
ncbi:hypothetical protein [Thermocrispum municipale]|uniref:hypothetical protein n=1 Tax=Thermocrispum municipale TaxID=37926 RepID=UPI000400D477|nr:hypothetical protein [Thermocrispum municipale]